MGAADSNVSSWPKKKYETWSAFSQSLSMKTGSNEEELKKTIAEKKLLETKRAETKIPVTTAFYEIPQLEPLRATHSLEIFEKLGSGNLPPSKQNDKHQMPPSSKRQRVSEQNGGSGSKPENESKRIRDKPLVDIYDKDMALYSSAEEQEEPEELEKP
ncbi:hypothetical protein LPJ64_006369, partial [Coemansia asiatica]